MSEHRVGNANQSVIINSVDRTIDIIEYLYLQDKGVSISQISKDLGLYKSTVYRTLATLQNRGYIEQNVSNEMYSLGPKIYALKGSEVPEQKLVEIILPYLKQLNDKYCDSVNLGVLDVDGEGMYRIRLLAECASKSVLGVKVDIESMSECYCASLGKCLLAFSDNVDLSVYESSPMTKFTDSTITTVKELEKELEKIKKCGYACDDEEREVGLFCVGVPIFKNGKVVAAMSLAGPKFRIMDGEFQEKINFMKDLSAEITRELFVK